MRTDRARQAAAAVFSEFGGAPFGRAARPDDDEYHDELWIPLGALADAFDRFACGGVEWSTTPPTEPDFYWVETTRERDGASSTGVDLVRVDSELGVTLIKKAASTPSRHLFWEPRFVRWARSTLTPPPLPEGAAGKAGT